jgi:hypothetical protein
MSSLPASLISLAWQEPFMRRKARILFGVQNVDDFVEVFSGYMNEMPIEDAADGGTISVLIDSKWLRLSGRAIFDTRMKANRRFIPAIRSFHLLLILQTKK